MLAEIAGDSKALPSRPFDGIFIRSFDNCFLADKPLGSSPAGTAMLITLGDLLKLRVEASYLIAVENAECLWNFERVQKYFIAVEAGDGACSRETFSIRTAARLIFQSSAKQVLTDPVEHPPKIVAGVLVAARFEQLLWTDGCLLRVFIREAQRGGRELSRFSTGHLPCAECFDAGGDGRNLIQDAEAGFNHLVRGETGVANRDSLECVAVRDKHPVGANEPIETQRAVDTRCCSRAS